ncbi:MAG: PorV/PorQ family protein [candidate division WOR-3 bacterium]|nr:PorV/PorQ family protein [candidate division WOR-3 bacterium]
MKKYIISLIVLLLIANGLMAMNEGTAGAQFLKIPVGGRATAMAGAFVALADDISTLYYNPAGLVKLNQNTILLNYVKWPAGIGYSYVGMAFPMGVQGAFGIQAGIMSVPEMEVTTVDYPEGTDEYFGVSNYFVGLTYSRYFTDKLAVGLTTKLIQEVIYDASSSMMAVDLGASYETGFKSLRIGMAIRNFGSDGQFTGGTILSDQIDYLEDQQPVNILIATEPYPIPLNFNFGVAYDFLEGPDNFLTGVIEFQNPNDGPEAFRMGAEYSFADMMFARLGYMFDWDRLMDIKDNPDEFNTEEKIEGLTAGMGFKQNLSGFNIGIDYSYTGMGKLGGSFTNGHRVSLSIGF